MEQTHPTTAYRQAVLNFINGKCPPGDGEQAGQYYDPEVEDLDLHCEKNCDVPACFKSWFETREGKPLVIEGA